MNILGGAEFSHGSTPGCVQDRHPEFRPVRAPKTACLHTCGPDWQCDHASGFREWRRFCPSSTRDQKSGQVCHNASALQGCQFPEPQIDGHYLSTERQNGLGYDPGNPGRLSTALIETNTVEPVRMNLPLHSVRSSSAREMPTLGSTARESRLPAAKTCRSPRRRGLQRGRHAGLEVLAIRPGEALGHRRGYSSRSDSGPSTGAISPLR